jgi:uncharacterized protein (DUF2147 family)
MKPLHRFVSATLLSLGILSLGMTAFAGESPAGGDPAAEGSAGKRSTASTPSSSNSPKSPIGRWKTIDEKSGKAKSIVLIWEENGKLKGKVESLFREPGQDPDPVCDLCPEGKKGEKIRGMTILWDLSPAGEWWEGGRILDPANGKVYRCRMLPMESGAKLQVRGFIGISMLGRSQVWLREP